MNSIVPKDKLIEYLRTIIQLESMRITHSKAKNVVQEKISNCNKIISIKDDSYQTVGKVCKPSALEHPTPIIGILAGGCAGFFIAIACFIIRIISYVINHGDLLGWLFADWDWGWIIKGALLGALVGFIIGMIILFKGIIDFNKSKKAHTAAVRHNNIVISNNNSRLADRRKSASNLKAICLKEADVLNVDEKKINNLITNIYACNIIYPKYQKIEYICKAYDYLNSGICTTLEGPTGVYARLEEDIKHREITDKLDIIVDKLDVIINNQRDSAFMLTQLVSGVNKLEGSLNSISNKFDVMSKNITSSTTAIETSIKSIEYNSAVTSQCAQFSALCDYYRLKKYI